MLVLHIFQKQPLYNKENKPVRNKQSNKKTNKKHLESKMKTGSDNVGTGSLGPFTWNLLLKSVTGMISRSL